MAEVRQDFSLSLFKHKRIAGLQTSVLSFFKQHPEDLPRAWVHAI